MKGKGILPPSQTEFRRGIGTIDQIFVSNYLINKKVAKRSRRMVVMFIDMKAAFVSVDRDMLVESIKKREVREGLVSRCEEVLREVLGMSTIKVEEKEGGKFWTGKGVRQGYQLSPCLFTLLLADLDEVLKEKWGRIKVKEKRIYSLAHADDVAVVAEDEESERDDKGAGEVCGKGIKGKCGENKNDKM